MEPLSQEGCAACRQNSPRVTAYEIVQLKPQIPDWNLIEKAGVPQLERTYRTHLRSFGRSRRIKAE